MNKNSKLLTYLMAAVAAWLILSSCNPKIHQGWYRYSEIKKAGYDCTPYQGRHYIRPTQDSAKVNIKPVK